MSNTEKSPVLASRVEQIVMLDDAEMMIPFSNGTDFMVWRNSNCDDCAKDCPCGEDGVFGEPLCDIEEALSFGAVSKGEIPVTLAERIGIADGEILEKCKEFEYSVSKLSKDDGYGLTTSPCRNCYMYSNFVSGNGKEDGRYCSKGIWDTRGTGKDGGELVRKCSGRVVIQEA